MTRRGRLLFVGDDWAEAHHDVEVMNAAGQRLAKARLPEGVVGVALLHAMIGEQLGVDSDEAEVLVGIETDRGPWVQALIAAGYTVFAINPLQVARYRERHCVSGAKSDAADAHTLADMVRTDSHQLRSVAADTAAAEAVKVVTRAHKTLIWERTRHTQRLRHALHDYFPAALAAFEDLDAADALELLAKAPDPASAARADDHPDQRCAHACPAPQRRGEGRPDPHRVARAASGPARGHHRGLRGHHPRRRSGPEDSGRAGQGPARAGRCAFWPAPGR